MAKKIRKTRTSLLRVFFLLLTPWAVMAVAAATAFALGAPDYVAVVVALVAALAATYYIGNYVLEKRAVKR